MRRMFQPITRLLLLVTHMNLTTKVYFTEDSFRDLVLETAEHPNTETGGILLGRCISGSYYVVEVLDPGPRSILQPAYFEYNSEYATHLANKVARRYETPLQLIGLWHRHPGSLDTFSRTDDQTHGEYLRLCGHSIVSGLVNIDPTFRLTFYRIDSPRQNARVPVEIGIQHFPETLVRKRIATEIASSLTRKPRNPEAIRRFQQAAEHNDVREMETRVRWRNELPDGEPDRTRSVEPSTDPPGGFFDRMWSFLGIDAGPRQPSVLHPGGTHSRDVARAVHQEPNVGPGSPKQVLILDLIETELDWVDSLRPRPRYLVSPQEPGYRVAVTASNETSGHPTVDLVIYQVDGQPVVAVDGVQVAYQPDFLRTFYAQWLDPDFVSPSQNQANSLEERQESSDHDEPQEDVSVPNSEPRPLYPQEPHS